MPKTNDFLRPFFLDFWRVWGFRVFSVGPLFGSKNQFFSLFFWSCYFLSILKRFGKVLGGFGEALRKVCGRFGRFWGRVWQGLGRVWAKFKESLGRAVLGNFSLEFWLNVPQLLGIIFSSHWPERGWAGGSHAALESAVIRLMDVQAYEIIRAKILLGSGLSFA